MVDEVPIGDEDRWWRKMGHSSPLTEYGKEREESERLRVNNAELAARVKTLEQQLAISKSQSYFEILKTALRAHPCNYPGHLPPFRRLGDADLDVSDFVTTHYNAGVADYDSDLLGLPRFHSKFDWWVTLETEHLLGKGFVSGKDPSTIFCCSQPAAISRLLQLLEEFADATHNSRTIVFGGSVTRLSAIQRQTLEAVSKFCDTMRWEAKDVDLTVNGIAIGTLPAGLVEKHYRHLFAALNEAIYEAPKSERKGCVLIERVPLGSVPGSAISWIEAKSFAEEHADIIDSLSGDAAPPEAEYWATLRTYRFMLYPEAFGVQSHELAEALLLLTIPIAIRCLAFTDLQEYGFPIVLVDSLEEVTGEALEQWWEHYSPRRVEGREKLLVDNYFAQFVRG